MGVDTNLYKFVFVLHILAVIIGFGGTFIATFYGMEAQRRPGREGSLIAETTMKVTELTPTMAIYSVPILGILLILLSDDTWKFSELWVSLSFVLYAAILVIALAVHVPNIRQMIATRKSIDQGGPNTGLADRERKAALYGGILNVLWIVVVFLMVFKPGH